MTLTEEKAALRQKIRTQRNMLPDREMLDKRLLQNLLAHPWMQETELVLTYYSGASEPDTHALIDLLLASGKQVALPVTDGAGSMDFYLLRNTDELQKGAYDIPEPSGREVPVLTETSLCIVPGVAFTEAGERLGQGGGYYDRFLTAHPGLRTVGLTYQCLLQASLPCEAHDCRVDIIITDGKQPLSEYHS